MRTEAARSRGAGVTGARRDDVVDSVVPGAPAGCASQAATRTVAVFGAYGHTGLFVLDRLRERGWIPVPCGRDATRLAKFANARAASVDDPGSLDRALQGACAVINCSGPFLDTAAPLIEAALRARIDYFDVCAEQIPVLLAFEQYDARAKAAGIAIVPAMAFFGGLADLLATAAAADWAEVDTIDIAVAQLYF